MGATDGTEHIGVLAWNLSLMHQCSAGASGKLMKRLVYRSIAARKRDRHMDTDLGDANDISGHCEMTQ